jgi:hypothetical protein
MTLPAPEEPDRRRLDERISRGKLFGALRLTPLRRLIAHCDIGACLFLIAS